MIKPINEVEVLEEIENIENSKPVLRMLEKTQVLVPLSGRDSIVKNRLTHCYEVSTSAKMIAAVVAKSLNKNLSDIDYQSCLHQVSLLHDVGHPPFGHDGQKIIDQKFKEKGLTEGFCDNNNNLIIVEAHNIQIRNYIKASIIKYPERLYSKQKELYNDILLQAIAQDKEHYQQLGINLVNQKTTIACQIMDEADRNSYTCSDLIDFFTLGNTVDKKELKSLFKQENTEDILLFKQMENAIESNNSREIRSFFSGLKNSFNANFQLSNNGITHVNENLFAFRESLSDATMKFFIKPIREDKFHLNNMAMLELFINKSIEDEDYCRSSTYKDIIAKAADPMERLTAIRDMVSEVGDWFVIKQVSEMSNSPNVHKLPHYKGSTPSNKP